MQVAVADGQRRHVMGDVINLSRHRKERQRLARELRAAQRKARYGRSKDERELARWEAEHREKDLDGKRLGGNSPGDDPPTAG